MIILETNRLLLREFTSNDAAAMCRLNDDRLMMRDMDRPEDNSIAAERLRLTRYIGGAYRTDGFGIWACVMRDSEDIVGRCGLRRQPAGDDEEIEITYQIASALWGCGIATEAARAIRDYAFTKLGIQRLIGLIAPDNIASRRVAEKIGMDPVRRMAWRGKPFDLYEIARGGT